MCWRNLMTLIYWERHLIPRWLFRSIIARFPEQRLKGLVSWGSPVEYFMIDCSGDPLDRVVSGAWFFNWGCITFFSTGGVFERNIAHRRSVTVLCMLYKIRCNQMHPLYVALSVEHVPGWVTLGALVAHRYTYKPPRRRASQTVGLLFLSQCLCGTILLTLYGMVWDWWVLRACPMFFHWPNLLVPFLSSTAFPFPDFLSVDYYCGAGVFGLIWCQSLSPCLSLQTCYNGNRNFFKNQAMSYRFIKNNKTHSRYSVSLKKKLIIHRSVKQNIIINRKKHNVKKINYKQI